MTCPVRRRLHAQNQLELHATRIAEHNLEAAYRFIDAVEATFALLAEMPESGPRYETDNPALANLRKWVIPRHRRYLVFYLFDGKAVHVIDVVDGRSDYDIEDKP